MRRQMCNINVDTLYYLEGSNIEVNNFVRSHTDMLQKVMGERLFSYTILYLRNEKAQSSGCFYCRIIPRDNERKPVIRSLEVGSTTDIIGSLSDFSDEIYSANLSALNRRPETHKRRFPVRFSLFGKATPPLEKGGAGMPVAEMPRREMSIDEELCEERDEPMFSCSAEPVEDTISAKVMPTDSVRDLAQRIRDEILALQRMNGINVLVNELGEDFIRSLTMLADRTPAPLLIDDRFRIFISATSEDGKKIVNNQEVQMPTLSKVVYFLFLRHAEGIRLKEIADYREELMKIYLTVSPRDDMEQMRQSIDDLTNPESGSLNQKISRITAAFRQLMPSDLAQHYIITGPRGEARRVLLDRSLVSLPMEIKTIVSATLQK